MQVAIKRDNGHAGLIIVALGAIGILYEVYINVALRPATMSASRKQQGKHHNEC